MADAKQGKPVEELHNGSSQTRIVLAKPKLGGFGSSGFGTSSNKGSTNNAFGSVLRPPQLKTSSNPFIKISSETNSTEKENEAETSKETESRLNDTKDEEETPKFVPLRVTTSVTRPTNTTTTTAPIQPANSSSGFVFGQNLSERVVIQEAINNGESSKEEHSTTNGTSELLFTSAAATVKENTQDEAASNEVRSESLAAAAAEYERSHAKPPPATSNCTMTGEEGEINVLQVLCRLFAWESGSWRERGRGALRLNDTECGGSRVVARVAGSLRVVLNTKLWPDMVVERAGTKSLRITAADTQLQIKLFLIMGAPSDIAQLHRALLTRIAISKRTNNKEINTNQRHEDIDEAGKSVDDNVYAREFNEDSDENNEIESDRLELSNEKTESDGMETNNDVNETKVVKRKEPIDDETSPKRQCTDVSRLE